MNRFLASLSLLALLTPQAHAATALYGVNVSSVSFQTYEPAKALGAPDGQYATFFAQDASVTLDLGELAKGDLVMDYQLLSYGAKYRAWFYDGNNFNVGLSGTTLNLGTQMTVPGPTSGASYRYVQIVNDSANTWKLDALTAQSADTAPAPTEPGTPPAPTPAPESPLVQGSLVKLPSDGNAATTFDSAVYAVGNDGKRHAFPAESVFFSWFKDFSTVQVISAERMAALPLGKNVTVRPGTKLVKVQTDPKTYAVAAGGTLRWVPTEALAVSLFGPAWAKNVVDVADTFFGNYAMGPALGELDAAPSVDPNAPYPY